jgi:hypothetical protein
MYRFIPREVRLKDPLLKHLALKPDI